MNPNDIKKPVAAELKEFEIFFKDSLKSRVPLLQKITQYIVKRKGKQMRPLFVLLTAKMLGEITQKSYRAAALIELLHTATLVHDDVVDDAYQRRGFFSINALWKNKIAVLVGDFLLSRTLLLSVENGEIEQLRVVSTAVKEMSEGELLQIEKTRGLNFSEEIYFEIIRQKTASLIHACCKSGAISVGASADVVHSLGEFGTHVGIAFQIKDDLFDFGSDTKIGKPTGIDIKEKKLTLPLIYALNNAEKGVRKEMARKIKKHHTKPKKVKEVIDFVWNSGGIEYAKTKMMEHRDQALAILKNFPDNEAKVALESLVNYSINREK
ncbi:MAG: octaprenyl-diphosphate synthase [Sphingobacteriales bacterium]|jgi:octaprenyl-diphosphate synthase